MKHRPPIVDETEAFHTLLSTYASDIPPVSKKSAEIIPSKQREATQAWMKEAYAVVRPCVSLTTETAYCVFVRLPRHDPTAIPGCSLQRTACTRVT